MIVHILSAGRPLCGFTFEPPFKWTQEHQFVTIYQHKDATCDECKKRLEPGGR